MIRPFSLIQENDPLNDVPCVPHPETRNLLPVLPMLDVSPPDFPKETLLGECAHADGGQERFLPVVPRRRLDQKHR